MRSCMGSMPGLALGSERQHERLRAAYIGCARVNLFSCHRPCPCRQRAFFQGQLDKLRRQAAAEAKAARIRHSQDLAQNATLLAQLNDIRQVAPVLC
jgi:hypothetical protein